MGVQEILVVLLFAGAVYFLAKKFMPTYKKKDAHGSCDNCAGSK